MDDSTTAFENNFRLMCTTSERMRKLDTAMKALDKSFGYTAGYNDSGYVPHDDRDPSYKAAQRTMIDEFDSLLEDHSELLYPIVDTLMDLPESFKAQLINLVNSYLTNQTQA